jgi:hypothetical protein
MWEGERLKKKNEAKRPPALSADKTRSLIRAALAKAGRLPEHDPGNDLGAFKRGRASQVGSLPPWVGRFGILAGSDQCCLWCDPRSAPGEIFPSQMVIDVPCGRYLVETLDSVTSTWISRESAEGGPLVAGLSYTGNPVMVWIRLVI